MPAQEQYPPLQNEQDLPRAETNYNYKVPINGKPSETEYIDAQINRGIEPHGVIPTPNEREQVCNFIYDCSLLLLS